MGDEARVVLRTIGGPTAVIEVGGLRLITDPTFDEPGEHPVGTRILTKTAGPALQPGEIGPVAAVLLSHDQHPDNLDTSGRAYLSTVALTLTTGAAAARLGGSARALGRWERADLERPDGGVLRVTSVPAQHGPDGTGHLTGEVTGFVLTAADQPTVYVSGDNASLRVVREVAERFGPVDVAVLFAGAARTPLLGDANLTLSSADAAEATEILGARYAVPVHHDSWAHFTENADDLRAAFAAAGLSDRLVLLKPGEQAGL